MNVVFINVSEEERTHIVERITHIELFNANFFSRFNEAQRFLKLSLTDIVLLDITEGNLKWIKQYKKIKLIDNAILIVLVGDNVLKAVKAYEVGAFDYLLKPVTKSQLERIFQKARNFLKTRDNAY